MSNEFNAKNGLKIQNSIPVSGITDTITNDNASLVTANAVYIELTGKTDNSTFIAYTAQTETEINNVIDTIETLLINDILINHTSWNPTPNINGRYEYTVIDSRITSLSWISGGYRTEDEDTLRECMFTTNLTAHDGYFIIEAETIPSVDVVLTYSFYINATTNKQISKTLLTSDWSNTPDVNGFYTCNIVDDRITTNSYVIGEFANTDYLIVEDANILQEIEYSAGSFTIFAIAKPTDVLHYNYIMVNPSIVRFTEQTSVNLLVADWSVGVNVDGFYEITVNDSRVSTLTYIVGEFLNTQRSLVVAAEMQTQLHYSVGSFKMEAVNKPTDTITYRYRILN